MNFELAWLIEVSGGKLASGPADSIIKGFASDSRHKGDSWLFVALKGEKTDGHDHLAGAFENGARAALVSRIPGQVPEGMSLILVEDVILALGLMAKHHRERFSPIVFGVTGSAGKTTTKDMTAAVLSKKYKVLKTMGNLNTEIGCPLTLLNMEQHHEAAVIEMAMLDFGQIKYLTELAKPKKGIVTIVGSMHMEFLGSQEGIAKAKRELVEALPEDGLAIINCDDQRVFAMKEAAKCPYLTYGLGECADIRAINLATDREGTSFDVALSKKATELLKVSSSSIAGMKVPFAGSHQVRNALAAVCAGLSEGVGAEDAKAAIATFTPSAMRMTLKKSLFGFEVLDDSYNANPESVPAASESAFALAAGRPLYMVLGGMVELGARSLDLHHELGMKLAKLPIAGIVTMGKLGHGTYEGLLMGGYKKVQHTDTYEQAKDKILEIATPGSLVLVKGSRSVGMDHVVRMLTGEKETAH